jgi:hypothetical protein
VRERDLIKINAKCKMQIEKAKRMIQDGDFSVKTLDRMNEKEEQGGLSAANPPSEWRPFSNKKEVRTWNRTRKKRSRRKMTR